LKKFCFLTIILLIFSLGFSLKLDKYFVNVDLVNYDEKTVSFYFTNDKNYQEIIQIKNLTKNEFLEVKYPQEIILKPNETQKVDFVLSQIEKNVGSYFIFFEVSVKSNFISQKKFLNSPILLRINFIPSFDYHPIVEIYSGDLYISKDKLGTIFPLRIVNESNLILEISGKFKLTSKDYSDFTIEKFLFDGNSSTILSQSQQTFEIYIDQYLKPGKYQMRWEFYYGYKNYLQEKYVLEKEFTVPESLYFDRKIINFKLDNDKIYIPIPKEMSPREYITTPQEETLTILNNDFLDANLTIDFIEVSSEIPSNRRINPKYINETPSKISIKPYDKGTIYVVADYRRGNLQKLEGELFGTLQFISEVYSQESVFYNKLMIPIILDFGGNKYEVKSNIKLVKVLPIDKFYSKVNFDIEINNSGNSSVFYNIKIKKLNRKTGRSIGEEITISAEKSISPEQMITLNSEVIVELGVDTILINIDYYGINEQEKIILTHNHSIKL